MIEVLDWIVAHPEPACVMALWLFLMALALGSKPRAGR